MIREHAAVLLALFDSKKADGTPYSYAEMLTLVGLSATHDWVRALSKFFVANGKRRKVEYTWSRTKDVGELMPIEEVSAKVEGSANPDKVRMKEHNAHICGALSGLYNSLNSLLTLIEKDDKNFQVWRFLSWSKNNGGETATALCNSNGWFWQAINCMRDGDMGHAGEDGVYERIWWTDTVDTWDEPRAATPGEVATWERHCGHDLDDPAWCYWDTFFLNEGPIAIYMRCQ